jgi:hypothetical protein
MSDRNFDTFNSSVIFAGMTRCNPKFPDEYTAIINKDDEWPQRGVNLGRAKGIAMKYGANLLGIKNLHNVILLDNDPCYSVGVKQIDEELNTVCAGTECDLRNCKGNIVGHGHTRLTTQLIKEALVYK